MMNRRINRRAGIFLGALLGVSAIVLTVFSFKISMDASRALSNPAAEAHAVPRCR
ncbi:hypothetical protein PZB75_31970 (plasmid) [Streptomyces sp. AM 4-1-1]|uniref:hypothetical protein n=1 Tax=Streptomyces sp. AM 4-1-1 TaxID=3028710 RepID=UPI0023B94B94|nr:hypothetical protein [Streptomyces sp. AM 4-1-1]WEH38016.1 hypothetical protein PZB75_31970 [Streptomyces sp. AM 4-1-1]